jgi:hypothetical protein
MHDMVAVGDARRVRPSVCLHAAVALAIAVSGVACAAGDDASDGTVAVDVATSEQPDHAAEQAELAIAEAALLTIDDFPTGWEAEPADEPDSDVVVDDELERCLGVDIAEPLLDAPQAVSPTFTGPADEQIGASVTIASTTDAAVRAIEPLQRPDAPRCFNEAFEAQMGSASGRPEGVEIGEPTFERVPLEIVADESVVMRDTLSVTYQGVEVSLHGASAFARVGRGLIALTSYSSETPIDAEHMRQLTQIIVDRLSAARLE